MRKKMPLYTNAYVFNRLPNKVAALHSFWQSFFREVRRDIAGIITTCDLALKGHKKEQYLLAIQSTSKFTVRVMDKMWEDISLDLANIKASASTFLLQAWFKDLIRGFVLVHDLPDKDIKLTISPHIKDAYIETDEILLTQIVAHLLGNAFRLSEEDTLIELNCTEQNSRLIIEVNHMGTLTTQDRNSIFTPYLCGDDSIHDEGLGLYICLMYAEVLNGTIEAYSKNNATVFTVTIPAIIQQPIQKFPDV